MSTETAGARESSRVGAPPGDNVPPAPRERIATGSAALDEILDGGFPPHSMNIIMGLPGTGKTVLAERLVFHNATSERPALYCSTASEPLDRMLHYLQGFDFFDPRQFGESVFYHDLNEVLRTEGLAACVDRIAALLKEHRPDFLVIDSSRALRAFAASDRDYHVQMARIATMVTALTVTSFLIGEYTTADMHAFPEFAVADGVVELVLEKSGVRDSRYLRVLKLRGSRFLSGEHSFRITDGGLSVFPRVSTPRTPDRYAVVDERVYTGVDALDIMLGGGIWRGSSTIVFGPPGSGKTLLGLSFIFTGLVAGETGLVATLQENPTQLRRIAAGFGWDMQAELGRGTLRLLYRSPVEVGIDEMVTDIIRLVDQHGVSRVVLDSVNDLQAATTDPGRFRDFMYASTQALAVRGVNLLMTQEVRDLFATTVVAEYGISHMADNVVFLSYVRRGSQILRSISVIKTRASDHDQTIRRFEITSEGFELKDALEPSLEMPAARDLEPSRRKEGAGHEDH